MDGNEISVNEETLYLKYGDSLLIQLTELNINAEDQKKLFTVNVEQLLEEEEEIKKRKISIVDGKIVFNKVISEVQDTKLSIPAYLEIDPESSSSGITVQNSPVPCFDWDGSGTCCEFRYNGFPNNPLVRYTWCGDNCGGG